MLDRTKMPRNLWAHRVWVPADGTNRSERSIVYVTERRRRVIGGVVLGLGVVLVLATPLVHAPIGVLMVGLVISVIGGIYAASGRSGFYQVAEDGTLGEFLGRSKPELGSMRGMKVQ
jgi:hypothetical protein